MFIVFTLILWHFMSVCVFFFPPPLETSSWRTTESSWVRDNPLHSCMVVQNQVLLLDSYPALTCRWFWYLPDTNGYFRLCYNIYWHTLLYEPGGAQTWWLQCQIWHLVSVIDALTPPPSSSLCTVFSKFIFQPLLWAICLGFYHCTFLITTNRLLLSLAI